MISIRSIGRIRTGMFEGYWVCEFIAVMYTDVLYAPMWFWDTNP